MSSEINYQNNPLHGLGLKTMVEELVDHYGFEILYAYLQLNCFNTNPSVDSSFKFLKKTEWAREKVEAFYLYQFKNLPRASAQEFSIAPRDRIVPDEHKPGEPAELSLEDAARLQEVREKKAAEHDNQRHSFKGNGFKGNNSKKRGDDKGKSRNYGDASSPSNDRRDSSRGSDSPYSQSKSPYGNSKSPYGDSKGQESRADRRTEQRPYRDQPKAAPAAKPSTTTGAFDPWAKAKNKVSD
ncbi:MAG TPA: hypothetical protein DE179_12935 [Oceanospirillaceae bacterium]|nr:hypothetical protein [Oceanospirillaceae bacterium]